MLIDRLALIEALQYANRAVSQDRDNMRPVQFTLDNPSLTLCGTDGKRLHRASLAALSPYVSKPEYLSAYGVFVFRGPLMIARLKKLTHSIVQLQNHGVSLMIDDAMFFQCAAGTFPDWKPAYARILNSPPCARIVAPVGLWAPVLQHARILHSEITLHPQADGSALVCASDPNLGDYIGKLPWHDGSFASSNGHTPVRLDFNYFAEALGVPRKGVPKNPQQTARVSWTTALGGVAVSLDSLTDTPIHLTAIVMPLRDWHKTPNRLS